MMTSKPITPQTLQARAALAGVTLEEQKLEELAHAMNQSLDSLQALDLRAMWLVEPATVFRAAWGNVR